MLPKELIERSLALTGKTIGDMNLPFDAEMDENKFLIYLLSPEFIEKYYSGKTNYTYTKYFGEAIYEFQCGNERPLIDLLSKI